MCCTCRGGHEFSYHAHNISFIIRQDFLFETRKRKITDNLFSFRSFQHSQCVKNALLLRHAFSGCDITSSLYRQGKKKFVKLVVYNEERLFAKSIVKTKFNSASLPPTLEAVRQHCFKASP